MTEFNIFCYSEKYNDKNSSQQKIYRAFNIEVTRDRYFKIRIIAKKILTFEDKPKTLNDFWKSVTQKQWQELSSIPEAKNFKKGFEYISGCKIEEVEEMTLEEVCEELGKNVKIIK